MSNLHLPYKTGELVRTTVRAPDGTLKEKWRVPVQDVATKVDHPCCACEHFRFEAGQRLLKRAGGRGLLREAGVERASPNADKIGQCFRDGSLCDPLATCGEFRLARGWACAEAAVAHFMAQ